MVDRIQITKECYMELDGQGQIVLPGSIVDVPSADAFSGATIQRLSPAEAAGVLASHGKPTRVRNIRTR
jgi:hypothetical protein